MPGLQALHELAPASEIVPIGQDKQLDAPGLLYVFGLHSEHRDAPAGLNVPPGHLWHEACPVADWKKPGGHDTQELAPAVE